MTMQVPTYKLAQELAGFAKGKTLLPAGNHTGIKNMLQDFQDFLNPATHAQRGMKAPTGRMQLGLT